MTIKYYITMPMIIINQHGKRVVHHIDGILTMKNGKLFVNGKPYELDECVAEGTQPIVNIEITGNVERLDIDVCNEIRINGNCRRVHTQAGDITITGDVDGDVHTNMGSITCGNVAGDAYTNMGSVNFRQ